MDRIPAFLAIDVEPDAFQLSPEQLPAWAGFEAMVPFVETLRERLAVKSTAAPVFGWYLRTDPQIGEIYGRPDIALRHYARRLDGFRSIGDYIGAHPHPLRWNAAHAAWVHDVSDGRWLYDCTASALEVFAEATGKPAPYLRFGAGILSNEILNAAEAGGVRLDLTLEPVAGWGLNATEVTTSVDSSPIVGQYIDCEGAPREPYQPERDEFRVALAYGRRDISIIPLTSVFATTQPPYPPRLQMLFPSVPWPSPDYFWDVALEQLRAMERPYLSLAIRTDTYDMALTAQVRKIFEALPDHEIAGHLSWMDPLDALGQLLAA